MENGKVRRTTNRRQFKEMVEQMKAQPDIARSNNKQSPELVQEFWEVLAETLNSLGPPFKDISEWKKVWSDFKSSIKKKLTNNKKSSRGENEEQFFPSIEDEVIHLVSLRDCVESVPQTRSFGMPRKRKLETSFTADSSPPVSPTNCFEEKTLCDDVLPIYEVEVLNEYDVAHEDENAKNLTFNTTSKKRYTGKTPCHTQLLEEQIGLQKKLYEKVSVVLSKNEEQARILNNNIEKMFLTLDRLDEHEAKKNDILQSLLEETKRHNRRMEKLSMDKEQYLSDSMSE